MAKNDQDAKVTASDEKEKTAAKKPAAPKAEKPAAEKAAPKAEKPAAAKPEKAEVKAEKPAAEKAAPKAEKPAAAKPEKAEVKAEKPAAEKAAPKAEKPAAAKPEKAEVKAEKPAADRKEKKETFKPEKKANPDRYRLKKYYLESVVPALQKQFNYKNVNQVPKLEKISLNMRLGDVKDNSKSFKVAVDELMMIAGQKPVITKAKKSVANFKVREGMNLGAKVTLRGNAMYEFMDKLVSVALPRVRDFRGIPSKSFDGRGNYSMGVKEQLIFPEINYDLVEKIRGFDIGFVTSAKTDEEARELLRKLGMPFKAD